MLKRAIRLLVMTASLSLAGCGVFETQAPRVVIVNPIVYDDQGVPSDVVKLGPGKVRVYVYRDGAWALSRNEVELEGWLAAPPPPKKETP